MNCRFWERGVTGVIGAYGWRLWGWTDSGPEFGLPAWDV